MDGMEWYGMVWNGMEWFGMVWTGMEWYGMEGPFAYEMAAERLMLPADRSLSHPLPPFPPTKA